FTLVDQEGRLFKPLAYTKTFAMAIAAFLAVTLDPALRMLFTRMDPFRFKPAWLASWATTFAVGRYYPEEQHPISKRLFRVYEPVCRWTLKHAKAVTIVAGLVSLWALWCIAAMLLEIRLPTVPIRGFEFMPPLYEGSLLFMPTTLPGISVAETQRLMQTQ